MSNAARENKLWIVAGRIPEKHKDRNVYNTSMTFGADGSLKHIFRKIHLFRICTEEVCMDESTFLTEGSEATCVDIGNVTKFGVGICFDIRFPQPSWKYALEWSSFLVYLGVFNMVSGPLHWELAGCS